MAAISIATALATLQRQLKDDLPDLTADTNALLIEWANFIDRRLYHTLWKTDPERYASQQTISVTSGTASYSLESDFRSIDFDNGGAYDTDDDGNLNITQPLTRKAPGSQTRGYYIDSKNSNIVFTPTPQGTDTIILRYIPALTTYTATSDNMLLDDEYAEGLNNAFAALYAAWKRDPATAFYDDVFIRSLDDILDNYNAEANNFENLNIDSSYGI